MRITGGSRRRPTRAPSIKKAPKWEERPKPKAKLTELEKKLGRTLGWPRSPKSFKPEDVAAWRADKRRKIEKWEKLMRIPQKIKRMK